MTTPDREEKCCEKCLIRCRCIEGCGNKCANRSCPCHSPKEELATCDEPWGCDCGRPSKEEVQESGEGDSWEEEFDKEFGFERNGDAFFTADFCDQPVREFIADHIAEARSLALQEAAARIRAMKSESNSLVKEVRNDALEDAAREIESKVV